MGWSGGTDVCIEAWSALRLHIKKEKRVDCLVKLIDVLREHDWDCIKEIEGEWPEAKKAIDIVSPPEEEIEEAQNV